MSPLGEFVKSAEGFGLTDVMLPFLLIFTVFFAILMKSKVLSEKRNVNLTVGVVLALVTVMAHVLGIYPKYLDPVLVINNILQDVSIVVIASLMVIHVAGIMGLSGNQIGQRTIPGMSLMFIILIDIFIYITFPYMFTTSLYISIFIIAFDRLYNRNKERGWPSMITPGLLLIWVIIIRNAIPFPPTHVPAIIEFLEKPIMLSAVMFIGTFILVAAGVSEDEAKV